MASGLVALLDDVAGITRLAAASLDDIAGAAGKAGVKAAGVVVDDTAVTPRYVTGFTPDRELPIIWRIALGSLRNKLLILLPAAIALSAFAPWAVTPLLMIGGAYLAFEATEKIIEAVIGHDVDNEPEHLALESAEIEKQKVSGAIRTDFILSAEIMAIALAEVSDLTLVIRSVALAAVAIGITVAVYGVVALIVKMDDVGLHLAQRSIGAVRALGRGMVKAMPVVMRWLGTIGTAAMLWVGGGILVHGLHEFHFSPIPEWIDRAAQAAGAALPFARGAIEWIVNALGAAIVGAVIGGVIVGMIHLWKHRRGTAAEAH
ncbi:MAG: DUF808 domain-containing protein [Sphingomonadaceae bacterium]|nr:DUF808 domain-containing protein [Sphingomonadaceae bacterium]